MLGLDAAVAVAELLEIATSLLKHAAADVAEPFEAVVVRVEWVGPKRRGRGRAIRRRSKFRRVQMLPEIGAENHGTTVLTIPSGFVMLAKSLSAVLGG